ncbi:19539_t:CDS:1, partial [Cetraspora pellucida]
PRRPQTQGLVKKINFVLKDKLGKWLEDYQNKNDDLYWIVGLATIVHSMNLSICHTTNKRLFELVFDYEPYSNCILLDQIWSQGIRNNKIISDNVQIEEYYDIQFDNNNEDNIQIENDKDDDINNMFNKNWSENLLQ